MVKKRSGKTFYGSLLHLLLSKKAFIAVAIFSICNIFFGQNAEKMDTLLLNGDDWVFSVKEPSGWIGTTEGAEKLPSNVYFYPDPPNDMEARPLIYIQLTDKSEENMEKVIKEDMRIFKKNHKNTKFKGIAVNHGNYNTAGKVFMVDNEFYEYVTFLNPGKEIKYQMAIIMRVYKREANAKELDAYKSTVSSIHWFEGVNPIIQGK